MASSDKLKKKKKKKRDACLRNTIGHELLVRLVQAGRQVVWSQLLFEEK